MNPLTNMKNVLKLSESELQRGSKSSWHDQYKDSAWIFVGGLPYDLTEGDVICVFSQYGEIVNINLVRDKATGKQKGFCFICYEDQRSTILAVDNLNGIKVLGRALRVDHVSDYKPPKDDDRYDDETKRLHEEGCAPQLQLPIEQIKTERRDNDVKAGGGDGIRLPQRLPIDIKSEKEIKKEKKKSLKKEKKMKKEKKEKKDKHKTKKAKKQKKKSKKKKSKHDSDSSSSSSSNESDDGGDGSADDGSSERKRKKAH